MYDTREFWRESALEKSSSDIVIEDHTKYIVSYNKNTKMSLNLNFLDLNDADEFFEVLEDAKKVANRQEIPRISINTRRSDKTKLDSDFLEEYGTKKVVELSLCGRAVDDEIIGNLSKRQLPDDYELETVSFEQIEDNTELYEMITESFPDAFTASVEQTKTRIISSHDVGIAANYIQSYFLITHKDDGIVGFAKSSQITKGVRKAMVHLVLAAVDKDHRRKGLYKELLLARFTEGQKNNAVYAYTESDVETSRPILEKLGLDEIDRLEIHYLEL